MTPALTTEPSLFSAASGAIRNISGGVWQQWYHKWGPMVLLVEILIKITPVLTPLFFVILVEQFALICINRL